MSIYAGSITWTTFIWQPVIIKLKFIYEKSKSEWFKDIMDTVTSKLKKILSKPNSKCLVVCVGKLQ